MDRTLIVCASYRGVSLSTKACIANLERHGAKVLSSTGIPDVALHRNTVLTMALRRKGDCDVCLLVDDDMVWNLEAAAKVVGRARETGECWSAAYATKDHTLAATPLDWLKHREDALYMVGLGFCAVPVAKLEHLASQLGAVIGPQGRHIVPFCQCTVVTPKHDGFPRWCSEDYWFCISVGGVRLAPAVAAGHLKEMPLWPDDETLARLAANKRLESPEKPKAPSEPPPTPRDPSVPAPSSPKPTVPETPKPKAANTGNRKTRRAAASKRKKSTNDTTPS